MIKRSYLLAILLILTSSWLFSQQRIRYLDINQGLCGSFVNTIFQDQNGFIWAGTGNGLCRFDGLIFATNPTRDSLPAGFVETSFYDSNGNIWLGHNDGSLTLYDGKNFSIISPSGNTGSKIVGITGDKSGRIFAASQRSGIIVVGNSLIPEYNRDEFTDFSISSIAALEDGLFLIGTFEGVFTLEFDGTTFSKPERVEALPYTNVNAIYYDEVSKVVYLGTQDMGLVLLKKEEKEFKLLPASLPEGLDKANVQNIFPEEEGILWLSTFGHGAIQLQQDNTGTGFKILSQYGSSHGLKEDYTKQVIRDFEGNIWIATYGEGLAYVTWETFHMIPGFGEEFGNNVLSMTFFRDLIYLGGNSGIIFYPHNQPEKRKLLGRNNGLPTDGITALVADKDGNLYIGSSSRGIYFKPVNSDRITLFHISQNSLANSIHYLKIVNNTLWAATNAGVLVFNLPGNTPEIYSTEDGLPHNSVRHVFVDEWNKVWVATKGNRIFSITDKDFIQVADTDLDFSSIAVDKNGRIWAATMGHGVIMIHNDSLKQFSIDEGLLNNFCYGLTFDKNGHVWVGHRLGVTRINESNFNVRTFGTEIGITGDVNFNAMQNSPAGELLIGTTRGLLVHNPARARELPPPKSVIRAVYISDELVDHTKPIKLPFGSYKLRIEFTGISFSNPDKVTYRYKLEGYDLDWSDTGSENYAVYPRIDDGDFRFILISYNADGTPTEVPLELKISVRTPFWKQTWFLPLVVVVVVMIVILIIKMRERAQLERQKDLEEELKKRTREITEKNKELEKKNNDITDSINYARRIQGSILPPIHKIEMQFPGSFVFYRPRDIVSGDFYWFDKVSESKFLIVCADSTGHGVPGAFMSMIGTTLIKDICMRSEVQSPSDVLSMLDHEIAGMLNVEETSGDEKSTDGMDLTVCEIDLNTRYLRFASAMRPIILYHKQEFLYLRGSRNAIGGQITNNKEFENQGYQLEKGDIIYMFTDGYPDQFGGPYGKKYKIVRLKNLLSDICTLPVEKQELMIVNEFNNWKGDQDQVDDVLFMCIKV